MSKQSRQQRTAARSQSTLLKFEQEGKQEFISKLTPNKIRIIQLLDEGHYKSAIARRTGLSKSYVSKFVNELHFAYGLISVEFINPLTRRAVSYRVSSELKNVIEYTEKSRNLEGYKLFTPHNLRYKYQIQERTKPYSTSTSRFAAAKLKHKKTWCPKGQDIRHVFETKHETVGKVGVNVYKNSIEVYQIDRGTPIFSKSGEDATQLLAMALNDTAQRFVQEQGWDGVPMELGQPLMVSSPHYAFRSKIARKLTDQGQTQRQLGGGFEIDKSLEEKYQDKNTAEVECDNEDLADIVDRGLINAARIHEIVPALVKEELKTVTDSILNINEAIQGVRSDCNNVVAACQSGMTMPQQFTMLQTVVAQQSVAISEMQKAILKVTDNMGRVIDVLSKGRGNTETTAPQEIHPRMEKDISKRPQYYSIEE